MNKYESTSKIDWYSFSLFVGAEPDDEKLFRSRMFGKLIDTGDVMVTLSLTSNFENGSGRRPFSTSVRCAEFTLYYNHVIDHVLIEVSGEQCAKLNDMGMLASLIRNTHERCTRIDLATDIRVGNENMVAEFVGAGFSSRFRSVSDVKSNSGHSYYIGSRKSERMCRVYQYNEPHPRSGNLRVEVELKGARAKQCASAYATGVTIDQCVEASTSPYQFLSPIWTTRQNAEDHPEFASIKGKQGDNNTLYWIHTQVVPAIHRLMRDGVIPASERWLKETFLDGFLDDFGVPF